MDVSYAESTYKLFQTSLLRSIIKGVITVNYIYSLSAVSFVEKIKRNDKRESMEDYRNTQIRPSPT